MKKYISPEVELLALMAQDVIMLSDEEELGKDTISIADLIVKNI